MMELKVGTYFSAGTAFARTFRVVARKGNRTCMQLFGGPSNPLAGYQVITVSTISLQEGKLTLDANQKVININDNPDVNRFHFTIDSGRSGIWELTKDDFEPSGMIDECLAATGIYVKTIQGKFIPGLTHLIAQEPGSRINVRTGPGTNFDKPHFGIAGDEVSCLEVAKGQDGSEQPWYKVKFDRGVNPSGVEGWIRGDFVDLSDVFV